MKFVSLLLLLSLTLAACATAEPPEEPAVPTISATVTATVAATPIVVIATETTAAPSATMEVDPQLSETETPAAPTESTAVVTTTPDAPQVAYGRTAEGAFFHGSPDAPITLIDYSDFL